MFWFFSIISDDNLGLQTSSDRRPHVVDRNHHISLHTNAQRESHLSFLEPVLSGGSQERQGCIKEVTVVIGELKWIFFVRNEWWSTPHSLIVLRRGEDLCLSNEDVAKGPTAAALLVEAGHWAHRQGLDHQGLGVWQSGLLWHHATHITYVPACADSKPRVIITLLVNILSFTFQTFFGSSNIRWWEEIFTLASLVIKPSASFCFSFLSHLGDTNLQWEGQRPEPGLLALSSCMAGTGLLKRWQKQNMAQTKTPEIARPSWNHTLPDIITTGTLLEASLMNWTVGGSDVK